MLINRAASAAACLGNALGETLERAFAEAGQAIELELVDGVDVAEAVARHRGKPRLVVGGGDGTLGYAAAVLANTGTALAILPLGTRNHLAQQIGIPLDLGEAVAVALGGQRRRLNLASAGDRVFISNAVFGIYSRSLRQRGRQMWAKVLGSLPAAWHVLRHMRAQRFTLDVDGLTRGIVTPLLFIGNNHSPSEPSPIIERGALAEGRLSIHAVAAQRAHQLIGFALRSLVGLARPERDFAECANADEVVIEGQGWIECALDGEREWLPLPLCLRSLPSALGVVTPREPALTQPNLFRIHDSRAH